MAILSGGRLARGLVYHIERTAVFSRRVSQDEYSCYKHSDFQPDSMDNQHVRETADPLLSPTPCMGAWMDVARRGGRDNAAFSRAASCEYYA